eukprot:Amastigsp_a174663_523.p3 type:complete len:182 gc:universal Amastigsp_a174663_523:1008-1553(+)
MRLKTRCACIAAFSRASCRSRQSLRTPMRGTFSSDSSPSTPTSGSVALRATPQRSKSIRSSASSTGTTCLPNESSPCMSRDSKRKQTRRTLSSTQRRLLRRPPSPSTSTCRSTSPASTSTRAPSQGSPTRRAQSSARPQTTSTWTKRAPAPAPLWTTITADQTTTSSICAARVPGKPPRQS